MARSPAIQLTADVWPAAAGVGAAAECVSRIFAWTRVWSMLLVSSCTCVCIRYGSFEFR